MDQTTSTMFTDEERAALRRALGKLPYLSRIPDITSVEGVVLFLEHYAEAVKAASGQHDATRNELRRLQGLLRSGGELLAEMGLPTADAMAKLLAREER